MYYGIQQLFNDIIFRGTVILPKMSDRNGKIYIFGQIFSRFIFEDFFLFL